MWWNRQAQQVYSYNQIERLLKLNPQREEFMADFQICLQNSTFSWLLSSSILQDDTFQP